jgi:putative FmdB family regulatory protein
MPTYDYRCARCQHAFEVFQRMSDAPVATCPACGAAEAKRRISGGTFHLRGKGWYASDYGGGGRSGTHASAAAESGATPAAEAGPSSGAAPASGKGSATEAKSTTSTNTSAGSSAARE